MSTPRHAAVRLARRARRAAGVLVPALGLILLAWLTLHRPNGQFVDEFWALSISHYTPNWSSPYQILRLLVSVPAAIVGVVIVAVLATVQRRFWLMVRVLALVLGANLTTQALKHWVISRPDFGISESLHNSFPSGHTTFLVSAWIALLLVAPNHWRRWLVGVGTIVLTALQLAIIGLGWHRPSDVVAAVLVVMAWAALVSPQETPRNIPPWPTPAVAVVVAVAGFALAGAALWLLLVQLPWGASLSHARLAWLWPGLTGTYSTLIATSALGATAWIGAIDLLVGHEVHHIVAGSKHP